MNRPVLVVKLGSNALVDGDQRLDLDFLADMARQVAGAHAAGWQPVVVSSGAVACGLGILGQTRRPAALPQRQALAAIGQADLARCWQQALAAEGLVGAQVLLTAGDFDDRLRYLNLTAAFRALFEYDVVPIINENDVVAVEELAVGDNDRLSALLAAQLAARRLFLLTDIDGVYDRDPRSHRRAQRITELATVSSELIAAAGSASRLGTGGMQSKLRAADLATRAGVETVIAKAREPEVVTRLLAGAAIGTRVLAADRPGPSSRRRWLALARTCRGSLAIDAGAARALRERGTSLLPVGIRAVTGDFVRGDTVILTDEAGEEVARGLANLTAAELRQICGLKATEAARRLGYPIAKTAVHRDNIMLR